MKLASKRGTGYKDWSRPFGGAWIETKNNVLV